MGERDNVLRFCAEQRDEMERVWRRLGRYEGESGEAFCAYVFATCEPPPAETWDDETFAPGPQLPKPKAIRCEMPRYVRLLYPNRSNTDIFGHVLRKFSRATRASGVLILAESWLKSVDTPDYETAKRLRAEMPESLADAPGREEALTMSLEHIAVGRRLWSARILRGPDRLAPWDMKDMTESPTDSRLTGIVDTSS